MPHYLIQDSHSAQGLSALISSPEHRSAVLHQMLERPGGKMESLCY